MNRRCGVRSNKFVFDLYAGFSVEGRTDHHESKGAALRKLVRNQLIFDCFSRNGILFNRTYESIYYPLRTCQGIESVLEKTLGGKVITDKFSLKLLRTTAITRRKQAGKQAPEASYSVYDFKRVIFLSEQHFFLPCCVALRIAGYQLKEIYF